MTVFTTNAASTTINAIVGVISSNMAAIFIVVSVIVGISFVLGLIDTARGYDDTDGGKYWRSKFTGKRYKL